MNMNKILVSIILFFAAVMSSVAQTKDGGISADMLREITKQHKSTAADKALFNAIAANNIDDLATNYATKGARNNHFSI